MILIANGTVIDPQSRVEAELDILVKGDRIEALGKRGEFSKVVHEKTLDASGCWVVPGLIDLHVHLREPGFEWKENIKSGSEAAVLGGFTTICCMPNTRPTNDCREVAEYILEKARHANLARVLPIGSVSLALQGKDLAPFSELRRAGCVAFSDDGEPVYDAGLMRRALEWCLMLGVPIACHEEDKSLSCGGAMNESALSMKLGIRGMPKVAEDVMVARDIELAMVTKGRVHICHVSSARSVELIRRAKNDGILVTSEVTPHHLALTEDAVGNYDTNAKMSPPLREEEDREALLLGLRDGTIDAVASDHAPHEADSKLVEFSKATFGILGLQTSLSLMLNFVKQGKISRSRAIESLTSAPARAFGLDYGKLTKGSLADIAIIEPDTPWVFDRETIKSLSFNSPFLGSAMSGVARSVLVGGKIKVEHRKIV